MAFLAPLAEGAVAEGAGAETAIAAGGAKTAAEASESEEAASESEGLTDDEDDEEDGDEEEGEEGEEGEKRKSRSLKLPGKLGGHKVIVAEFLAAMVLIALTPIVGGAFDATLWLKRSAACSGLFLVLSLIAAGGVRASRIAAAFGGLVLLGLLISERVVFGQITALLGAGADAIDDSADTEDSNTTVDDTGE